MSVSTVADMKEVVIPRGAAVVIAWRMSDSAESRNGAVVMDIGDRGFQPV